MRPRPEPVAVGGTPPAGPLEAYEDTSRMAEVYHTSSPSPIAVSIHINDIFYIAKLQNGDSKRIIVIKGA
jgi:hypothetical protein